ncbi:MAG: hypothetical protein LBQ12_09685, partial [Deltaproteobacteria bacterium]|nr:hypothetical protein [Deltaproteobacteria bacterium]
MAGGLALRPQYGGGGQVLPDGRRLPGQGCLESELLGAAYGEEEEVGIRWQKRELLAAFSVEEERGIQYRQRERLSAFS